MTIEQPTRWGELMARCLLILVVAGISAQALAENEDFFAPLKKRLVKDGFEQESVTGIYQNSQVIFDVKGVSLFFRHTESKLNYDQFASKKSIRSARKYMEKYETELSLAEETYGVDREIVTAIILVETRLGKGTGRSSVISTLSTIAALADPEIREVFWQKISSVSKVSKEDYEKWVNRRSKWAYNELKAFLKYTDQEKIDPTSVKGSYAGAMGISQFMPSNILVFAKDGDKDGRIDLFSHADAIASVASYLKGHGWRPDLDREAAKKVVWSYNHSKYYVKIIFKISDILKG